MFTRNRIRAYLLLSLIVFSGCSTFESHPLIFASNHNFGATLSYSTATGPTFNVGFESQDVAIVPTVFSAEDRNVFALAVRGCYEQGVNAKRDIKCHDDAFAFGKKDERFFIRVNSGHPSKAENIQESSQHASLGSGGLAEGISGSERPLIRRVNTADANNPNDNSASGQDNPPKSPTATAPTPEEKDSAQKTISISIKDSLSVLSSFGTAFSQEAKKAEFDLGKIYATGAAAQHLTTGMGKKMANEGAAKKLEASEKCMAELNKLLGDRQATDDQINKCFK